MDRRISDSVVVHLELVHSVHVRDEEPSFIATTSHRHKRRPNEWIDAHKLQLHIRC
uniref:Uncharacterized protein n=1 Tax=Anopheles christyi TaxID=43041 RepID=A0A182KIT6_9DIPT